MLELEAKFLISTGRPAGTVLRRLQQSLAWAGFRIQPQGRRTLAEQYLDTPDRQLHTSGWCCRERRQDHGRHLDLETLPRPRAAIFHREALEQPLRVDEDASRPGPGPVRDQLVTLLHPSACLQPLFRVTSERDSYALSHPDHPGGRLELMLETVSIDSDIYLKFNEISIDLKAGTNDLMASALAGVESEDGLLPARLSNYQRGLLGTGGPLRRTPPEQHQPRGDARWDDVIASWLKQQLGAIRLYEPYAWEGLHPEGVHQMRVATRRARAALEAGAPVLPVAERKRLAAQLRWLGRRLGEIRDLDVQLLRLAGYRKHLEDGEQDRLDRYRAHLQRRRRKAQRRLTNAIESERYAALLNDFRAFLTVAGGPRQEPLQRVDAIAPLTVQPWLLRVHRRGSRVDENPSRLHRLRLDVKRLRYRLELLQDACDGELDSTLAALDQLQECLGLHQDAWVARRELRRYRRHHATGKRQRKLFKRLGRLEHRRARRQRRRLAATWQRFERASAPLRQMLQRR